MKKRMLLAVSIMLAGVLFLFVLAQVTTFAQEGTTRVIRIWRLSSEGKQLTVVEPITTRVLEGAVVVWWNKGGEEVRIRFVDGEKCRIRSSSPSGFVLESENCYQTSYMAPGTISSLKFDEEGTYEFEVEYKGREVQKGAVIVSKKE
jgi:hypothetical protein